MDPQLHRLHFLLLGYLLNQARLQAALDLPTAAARWGQAVERLEALEAGEPVDWWEVRTLIAGYGLDFVAFAEVYDQRATALSAPLPNLVPTRH
jgi:hypothetical protein